MRCSPSNGARGNGRSTTTSPTPRRPKCSSRRRKARRKRMKIKMKTLAAGAIDAQPGEVIEVDAKRAQDLLAGGYAERVTDDGIEADGAAERGADRDQSGGGQTPDPPRTKRRKPRRGRAPVVAA